MLRCHRVRSSLLLTLVEYLLVTEGSEWVNRYPRPAEPSRPNQHTHSQTIYHFGRNDSWAGFQTPGSVSRIMDELLRLRIRKFCFTKKKRKKKRGSIKLAGSWIAHGYVQRAETGRPGLQLPINGFSPPSPILIDDFKKLSYMHYASPYAARQSDCCIGWSRNGYIFILELYVWLPTCTFFCHI